MHAHMHTHTHTHTHTLEYIYLCTIILSLEDNQSTIVYNVIKWLKTYFDFSPRYHWKCYISYYRLVRRLKACTHKKSVLNLKLPNAEKISDHGNELV